MKNLKPYHKTNFIGRYIGISFFRAIFILLMLSGAIWAIEPKSSGLSEMDSSMLRADDGASETSADADKEYSNGNIKVLRRIAEANSWDYFFDFYSRDKNKNGNRFASLSIDTQKYAPPEFVFLEKDLFYIKKLSASGTGTALYEYAFYVLRDGNKLKNLITIPSRGHVFGWDTLKFDREFDSKIQYQNKVLTVDYRVKVFAKKDSDNPLIDAKRTISFHWNGKKFSWNPTSDIPLKDARNLYQGDEEDYARIFKSLLIR